MEGEQKGNRKQKVTGVLSDVGSKINFEVGRLATKDRWERQTERERGFFRGWHRAAISSVSSTERVDKIKEDKAEKGAEHMKTCRER